MRAAAVCALLLIGCQTSATVLAGSDAFEYHVETFSGWVAGCDNQAVCTLVRSLDGLPEGETRRPFIQIRRLPNPVGTADISLVDPAHPAPLAVLRPPLVTLAFEGSNAPQDPIHGIYYAQIDGEGGYRFRSEDALEILNGLQSGAAIAIAIDGVGGLRLDTAGLAAAFNHIDSPEVRDPQRHQVWSHDGRRRLTEFTEAQLQAWLARYLRDHPHGKVKWEAVHRHGYATTIRYNSFDFDCGILERWGHVGAGEQFVLIERSEMPLCTGVPEARWIQTYRARVDYPGVP